jgi:hypothetical protein
VGAALLACLLTPLGCGPSPEPHDERAVQRTEALAVSVPIGVYRGAGGWGAERIPAYETFLGRPVNYALDFQATDTWSNLSFPSWQADPWQASGKTLILGATGIFPGDWHRQYQGQTMGWAQAARGDYDSHWRTFGQNLVAKGQARAILRGAHEFNGGWFPHRVNPGEQEHFIAAWRRWVDIMRSIPGQQFSFDWNPTVGTEALWNPESAYPGDAYVTHIALDVYDGWYNRGWKPGVDAPPSQAERDAVWDSLLNGPRGLNFWKGFAQAHNKRLALPEWGLRIWTESDGLIHGGGDNPSFIERMHALINDPSWNIAYHAFWEDPKNGVSDPDSVTHVPVPNSRAAFLRLFAGSAQTTARTGTRAARAVLSGSPSWTNMWQTRAAAAGSTYEASVWVRGTGSVELKVLQGNWGAFITAVRCNATGSWVNCKTPAFSTGAHSQLTYVIQDQFGGNPAGTLYLDDAFLGTPGGANMLAHPSFEAGATGWAPSGVFSVP